MITLANLSPNVGANRKRKRVGRGPGSGRGKTATRGHKGANSRSGAVIRPGFEGGQMPLQRRLPKRGFHNKFKVEYAIITLSQLNHFGAGCNITSEMIIGEGFAKRNQPIKVLANGEITHAITVKVEKISTAAKVKIEAVGGKIIVLE
ncbi:MAG: 50S ribosomal protein L15 [Desulfocapsaceae bacterium]|jgi:large subunit ribosomal protein L15|nr:50S ribosomal protein L15 [Desulfocapsaceae bacterium]